MAKSIYQFKITLEEITPKIWRVIEVPSNCTFKNFNRILLWISLVKTAWST